MTIHLTEVDPNQRYEGDDGWVLQREGAYLCNVWPSIGGAWVLRHNGVYVYHDQYRTTIANLHGLALTDLRNSD